MSTKFYMVVFKADNKWDFGLTTNKNKINFNNYNKKYENFNKFIWISKNKIEARYINQIFNNIKLLRTYNLVKECKINDIYYCFHCKNEMDFGNWIDFDNENLIQIYDNLGRFINQKNKDILFCTGYCFDEFMKNNNLNYEDIMCDIGDDVSCIIQNTVCSETLNENNQESEWILL